MGGEEKHKIEDIKRDLYDPNDHVMGHQHEGILHQVKHPVSVEWKDEPIKKDNNMKNKNRHYLYLRNFLLCLYFFSLEH